MKRIAFADMPWQTTAAGVRAKSQIIGSQQLRLVEFTRDLDHPHWCQTGHIGYVLEGELEIEFEHGALTFRTGDGISIPAGSGDQHRPRAVSDVVRLIFVEALSPAQVVLFACIHNAGRSQMAAAWFNELADPAKARAISAGTAPGTRVHPEVVTAMNEVGVDLSHGQPRFLSDELAQSAALLVTMGCGEACPVVPGLQRDDWPLEDPKAKPVARVREIRDEIRARVSTLLRERGWEKNASSSSRSVPTAI
jgi:arsenate reductase (thioredoxin)